MMRDHPLCVSEAKHRRGGVSSEPNFRLVRRNRQHEQKVFVFIDNRVLCTYKSLKVLNIETATMRTNCTPTPSFHPPVYFGWSTTTSLVVEGLGQPTVMILVPYTIEGDPPYIELLADLLVRDVFIRQQQNTGTGDGP